MPFTSTSRRYTAKLTLMYKIQNNLTHEYIARLCPPKVCSTGYVNLRNNLIQFCVRTCYFEKSVFPSTVKSWNQLHENIRISPSLNTFKLRLNKSLRNNYTLYITDQVS